MVVHPPYGETIKGSASGDSSFPQLNCTGVLAAGSPVLLASAVMDWGVEPESTVRPGAPVELGPSETPGDGAVVEVDVPVDLVVPVVAVPGVVDLEVDELIAGAGVLTR
jgi:hypothetical protein